MHFLFYNFRTDRRLVIEDQPRDKMAGAEKLDISDLTLSEVLETDFLTCPLCKSAYQSPRLLPCLHSFCERCIQRVIKTENQSGKAGDPKQSGQQLQNGEVQFNQSEGRLQRCDEGMTNEIPCNDNGQHLGDWNESVYGRDINFLCPICHSEIQLNKNNKTGFRENIFLQDLCTMFEYKCDKTRHCEYCKFEGKVATASHLCLDCHDNMCQNCTSAHHRTKVTRGHKVIPYVQVQKGLYDIDIRDYQVQLCKKHSEETLTMFCERCEELMCKECKVEDHDNHKWVTADKAILKYDTQMKNLLGGIQKQIPSIHKYIQFLSNYDASVERNREKVAKNINEHSEMLHKLIDEQKTKCLEELNNETDKERCLIQVRTTNLRTAATSLENNATFLKLLLQHGKPDELLSLHRQINQRLTQLTHMQMDGMSTRLKAEFIRGSSSMKNVQILLGKLVVDQELFTHTDCGLASQNALKISNVLPNVKNTPDLTLQFEATGKSDTKEIWPTGIAVTQQNDYVIVDRDNKCIKIFTKTGQLKNEITGKGDNKLSVPFDVAVLKSGNMVVTDHEAEAVQVYTSKGEHVLSITDGIKYPRGVTVDAEGHIVVLDCQHRHLTIHDPKSGKLVRTIEGQDTKGSKVLVDPYYVAVTPEGNVVVTDTAAPHIKFFSPNGDYLAMYGNYGVKKDEILQPYGICCDSYGYIFVSDNQNHRIHVLLPDGKFCQFLLTKSNSLWHPMGVTITPAGHLALTEALGKVKVYNFL